MTKLTFDDCSHTIIGAYYEVYNHTSRNFPEYIYEQALLEELRQRGIPATRQEEYSIVYKGQPVGLQRLDLFVAGQIVVENKVAPRLTLRHKAQAISYLKVVDKSTGLLFNFGGPMPEFNRLYFNPAKQPAGHSAPAIEPFTDWLYPELAYQIVGGLYEVHQVLGAGFVHRIYANACYHELTTLRHLVVKPAKRIQVAYKGSIIGDIALAHLLVEGKIILFSVALDRLQDICLDNLKQWLLLSEVELGILANFNAVHLEIMFIRR